MISVFISVQHRVLRQIMELRFGEGAAVEQFIELHDLCPGVIVAVFGIQLGSVALNGSRGASFPQDIFF